MQASLKHKLLAVWQLHADSTCRLLVFQLFVGTTIVVHYNHASWSTNISFLYLVSNYLVINKSVQATTDRLSTGLRLGLLDNKLKLLGWMKVCFGFLKEGLVWQYVSYDATDVFFLPVLQNGRWIQLRMISGESELLPQKFVMSHMCGKYGTVTSLLCNSWTVAQVHRYLTHCTKYRTVT